MSRLAESVMVAVSVGKFREARAVGCATAKIDLADESQEFCDR